MEDYTIPRTVRELQPIICHCVRKIHYTIPRTVRELQLPGHTSNRIFNYTIPRTVRELQHQMKWERTN